MGDDRYMVTNALTERSWDYKKFLFLRSDLDRLVEGAVVKQYDDGGTLFILKDCRLVATAKRVKKSA